MKLSTVLHMAWLCLALLGIAAPARAHDPFDGATQMLVFDNKIEVKLTFGYDAARTFLRGVALAPVEVTRLTRPSVDGQPVNLPAALAPRLMTLAAQGAPIDASAFLVLPSDNEIVMMLIYPRPQAASITAQAAYFALVDDMRPGAFVAANDQRRILARALLTRASPGVDVPMTAPAATSETPAVEAGFAGFFKMGVVHILTGYDHLLFLFALLITVRRIGPMIGTISAFTLAHSLTLALAALDLVVLPSRIVEPLIVVSIIIVCIENVWRREATADRYWMAGGFGLIHGFGFATILRESALAHGGKGIVLPLLSFNLGVETGQLMVAAVVIPLLMLMREKNLFIRYGIPALSTVVMLVSSFWLVERLSA
ncbi:MAG: HupE/UreJ family protein [Massilia sp.]